MLRHSPFFYVIVLFVKKTHHLREIKELANAVNYHCFESVS